MTGCWQKLRRICGFDVFKWYILHVLFHFYLIFRRSDLCMKCVHIKDIPKKNYCVNQSDFIFVRLWVYCYFHHWKRAYTLQIISHLREKRRLTRVQYLYIYAYICIFKKKKAWIIYFFSIFVNLSREYFLRGLLNLNIYHNIFSVMFLK